MRRFVCICRVGRLAFKHRVIKRQGKVAGCFPQGSFEWRGEVHDLTNMLNGVLELSRSTCAPKAFSEEMVNKVISVRRQLLQVPGESL